MNEPSVNAMAEHRPFTSLAREDVGRLLGLANATDDQDTGSLDEFRAAADPAIVALLCEAWLLVDDEAQRVGSPETRETE